MATSQKVQIDTYDFGASLTAPTLGDLATGTTITDGTASTCNEQTADSGVYIADFVGVDASHLIPAGTYRLRTTVNGKPLKRFVTFTGVDGELVYARSERAAVLDSDSITAIQSGLATAAAVQSVKDDTGTTLPAQQLSIYNRIGAPAGASISADLASVKTDTGTTIPGLFTKVKKYLQLMFRKDAAIAADNATELAELNANGGTGAGSASNTTESLEAIRDRGDTAWTTEGGSGGGNAPTIVTLQAVAGISPGVIVGPSEPLVIGDDYLTVMNRSVRINLLDASGDPAEVEFGTHALDDDGISIQLLLARSGKPTTIADVVGTCTFFPAVDTIPPYLIVEFTKTETAKAVPGAYDMQAEAVWNDGKVVTFAPYGQIEFVRNIRRS